MSIKEGEGVHTKGIHNTFNKTMRENFPNLEKKLSIPGEEASKSSNCLDQNRTCPRHIIITASSTESKERILKAVRKKKQITYKGKPTKSQQISQ
jgi:hypothetical protein